MVRMGTILVIFLLFFPTLWGLGIKDIVVIILSQKNEHHLGIAENLKDDLQEQAGNLNQGDLVVHLSHRDFPHVGDWTVLPLLPSLNTLHRENSTWLFFIEDRTKVHLGNLLRILERYDGDESVWWLGYALHDTEATIIHHFAFYEDPHRFLYPNPGSGIAISTRLLKRLVERLEGSGGGGGESSQQADFGIDNAHELALFVWDKGRGQVLRHEPLFCLKPGQDCASYPIPFQKCGRVEKDQIYFAVKTCHKYHKERIPVVMKTWAKHTSQIVFFSDVQDKSIPTVSLGVPNTEQGHCAKTMAILHYVRKQIQQLTQVRWVVVADDDTILGVSRIREVLSCYNASSCVALGERYGYNVHSSRGYNYITGGGGMVFSRVLLERLTEPGVCECPSISAPDDMFLGLCVAGLGVSVTHSPLFHQARPVDYPVQYLQTKDAVSFHKHWMIDPVKVYDSWFAQEDLNLSRLESDEHSEL